MTSFDSVEIQLETFVENICLAEKSMAHTPDIVGRNRDGAALFQKWFAELNQTAETGGQAAYIFVMGSMAELLRVFDLPIVMPGD